MYDITEKKRKTKDFDTNWITVIGMSTRILIFVQTASLFLCFSFPSSRKRRFRATKKKVLENRCSNAIMSYIESTCSKKVAQIATREHCTCSLREAIKFPLL